MIEWVSSAYGQAVASAVVLIACAGMFLARFGSPARWVAVAAGAVLLDQEVKALILRGLPPEGYYQTYVFLGDLLRIKYYHNEALGFEEPFPLLFTSTVALGIVSMALYCRLARTEYRMAAATEVGGALIVGGLSGILLDRIRLGYVVDYLLVGRLIYNLADLITIVGCAALTARFLEVLVQAHRRGISLQEFLSPRELREGATAEAATPGVTVIARGQDRRLSSWVVAVAIVVLGGVLLGCIWHVGGRGATAKVSRAKAAADAER